uniref:Phosphoinositide phospholipase C n=1 Tax=Cyprinodon variegatus TaxID=28743 RepID=A0A3Q2DV67_CYPVA
MMSLRRDLFLLMMAYSDRKDHLTAEELTNFLHTEQKMTNVTSEYVAEIVEKFEVSDENKERGVLGIEGFTSFMRSPTCDIFNPLHNEVNQDMEQPLCNYFIASSHNTYLTGDQLLSHSKTDMYAWVLQSGCRCVEVDCWDGPDGEPMVQHGYTLTSKIPFKSVIETINKYAFINNKYPVILSIENHCNIQQQKKIAQYLREIFGDKLDVGDVLSRDSKTLPSPHSLQGKILIKGKRLPAYLSADAEEGEVSDDDSADEIEEDFKLKSSNGNGQTQVESHIRKKLDSLLKESRIVDKEDTDSFSIRALLRATHQGLQKNLRQSSKGVLRKSQSRSLITTLKQKRHSKSRLTCQSVEKEEDSQERSGREAGGQFNRIGRKRKTIKLSRDLSNLVVFTNSVASQECLNDGTPGDVLSFSETRAQSLVNHKAEQFLTFNQRQLSRIYPSAYRIDSSNFNPQFYWNVGCQLVALNYQTDGRMMQLNRSKFMVNGGIGYVLKPPPMCKGSFNPFSDDPLPAYPKKQLVLKIISGQQLPKPPDSMLGDRGEIIDPFVEVEIIGLPIDCCKEQTRVVDDNGFNPVWEETLSFTLHMAELALVRFLVWDHDPIGRDFIGQRTVAFSSLMPGYRHVYLEGLTEASIFVHVSVHDVYGKNHQLRGIRGFFNRSSKSSVDTNTSGLRKRSISDHLLRRTASAPAKGRKKTKMALSESVASISDHGNGADAGASGGEGPSVRAEGAEKPLQPRAPLIHRPISMPLDRLLQGQLSICAPDNEENDIGADSITGASGFKRPRSSSMNVFTESSVSVQKNIYIPSKTNRKKEHDRPDETSYLVIGGGETTKEEVYVNYQSGLSKSNNFPKETRETFAMSISTNSQATLDKPETSSNSTTFTVAPSVSSSSSSAISSLATVSGANGVLKSPGVLHDSTISRLIDAVSLDNEQEMSCSVSALIEQFEMTTDQKNLNTSSQNIPPSQTLDFRPTSPKLQEESTCPFIAQMASSQNKSFMNHQKPTNMNNESCSHKKAYQVSKTSLGLISNPETAELEEVYTILDEEVLTPVSVYNLRKQTVHVQADTTGSTPSSSIASSPVKTTQNLGKETGSRLGLNGVGGLWGESEEDLKLEERVYEEVKYASDAEPRELQGTSKRYIRSSSSDLVQILHHSTEESFTEVELNVDDPSEIISNNSKMWVELSSPVKCQAVFQNHDFSPSYFQPKHDFSYSPPQFPTKSFHAAPSKHTFPVSNVIKCNQISNAHQQKNSELRHQRSVDSRPTNPSPLPQNSYSLTQSNFGVLNYSKTSDLRSCKSTMTSSRSHQERTEINQKNRETGDFYHGFSSAESLPRQCATPQNRCRQRPLYSPSSDYEHSQPDYGCNMPSTEFITSQNIQLPSQGQEHHVQTCKYKNSPAEHRNHEQSKVRHSLRSHLRPSSAYLQSSIIDSTDHKPCKSKSLGDLTSEDISCNFQSKYHIISRSFFTPHTTRQKPKDISGKHFFRTKSCDPFTEQLRKLVSLELDDGLRERPQSPQVQQEANSQQSQPQEISAFQVAQRNIDDSPPPILTRRLSSRSQSRVRHINSRARERQQEAQKVRPGVVMSSDDSTGGVVLRNKPVQNQPPDRHSTGSYIAGYLDDLEDRGLPEGACTSVHYGNVDRFRDRYYTDDSIPFGNNAHSESEPEVYFLLRL